MNSEFKPTLHIVSQETRSIGEITSDLVPFFKKEFVVTEELKQGPAGYDYLLCHHLQIEITKDSSFNLFKKKILILPLDGTKLNIQAIEAINRFDLIIVPANASKRILEENGIVKPIKIIPNFYIEEDMVTPQDISSVSLKIPRHKVIFYNESLVNHRKGIDILYESYIRAFADTDMVNNVCLVIKDVDYNESTFDYNEMIKGHAINYQKAVDEAPEIIKISQSVPKEKLKVLWDLANCYVAFPRIEGFSIPMLRMTVLNKPIITFENKNSGYMDFINPARTYLVKESESLEQLSFENNIYAKDSKWQQPCIEECAKAFRKAYEDINDGFDPTMSKHYKDPDMSEYEIKNIAKKYIEIIKNN